MANIDDALAEVDWPDTFRRLTLYAHRRLGSRFTIEEAEDLAAEALRQVLDPAYRSWDPTRETLTWHLQSTINGLVSNRRRTKARSEERLHDFSTHPDIGAAHGELNGEPPERRLSELQEHATAQADPLAAAVVEFALNGIVAPKEVAFALGVPTQKIYDARQRLKRYAVALRLSDGE